VIQTSGAVGVTRAAYRSHTSSDQRPVAIASSIRPPAVAARDNGRRAPERSGGKPRKAPAGLLGCGAAPVRRRGAHDGARRVFGMSAHSGREGLARA